MTETHTPAQAVADLLIKVANAKPGYRAQELGGAARAILPFIESDQVDRADAYVDLHAAALATGLDSGEIRRTIAWNWGGDHMVPAPRVRDLYPAVVPPPPRDPVVDHLVVAFQLPEDDAVLDRIDRRSEGETTQQFATSGVAAIGGFAMALDGLAEHLDTIDSREPAHRLAVVMWDEPYTNDGAVREHLQEIKGDLDSALIRFKDGDKARTADFLANAILGLVVDASDLGLDLGEALARVVPATRPT